VVKLSDGENTVNYLLSVFLSKDYEVDGAYVKFGFKRLKLNQLKASVGFEIEIEQEEKDIEAGESSDSIKQ
jgi:hypothetical protein